MNVRTDADREHYRKERERDKQRAIKGDHDRMTGRIASPEKSEAERALEDLRSRLLSKRNKYDAEKQQNIFEAPPSDAGYRSERSGGYNHSKRDKERDHREHYASSQSEVLEIRDHKLIDKKKVIEVIDSPENYSGRGFTDRHQHRERKEHGRSKVIAEVAEDPELLARRAKLLDADREMARRKEMARDELEARRIMRREREIDNPISPQKSPVPSKRKKHSEPDESRDRDTISSDGVVHVSDDDQTGDDQSGTDDSEESSSHSENDTDEEEEERGENGPSDGELPVSPLSVGDLSKSERRRHSMSSERRYKSRSQTRSRSRSGSRSESRSVSKSNSRSPPSLRHRHRTPSSDFDEQDTDSMKPVKPQQPSAEELAAEAAALEAAKEALLPSYFPGVQGCRSVEEFQCLNRIEEGTYGVVYRARDKRTEEIVALKRLKMEKEKEGFPITSLREINTLLKGQHPNIVTVREIVVGSNMDKIFIVMDYVEHDLKSLMETMKNRKKSFLPGEVKCLTQQLLRAVGHLHDNWILHRDLKTSNLLLSHRGILKVYHVVLCVTDLLIKLQFMKQYFE